MRAHYVTSVREMTVRIAMDVCAQVDHPRLRAMIRSLVPGPPGT